MSLNKNIRSPGSCVIVLCLDLQSLPTHVNEVDQSGRVFCGYSKSFTGGLGNATNGKFVSISCSFVFFLVVVMLLHRLVC